MFFAVSGESLRQSRARLLKSPPLMALSASYADQVTRLIFQMVPLITSLPILRLAETSHTLKPISSAKLGSDGSLTRRAKRLSALRNRRDSPNTNTCWRLSLIHISEPTRQA